jgi:hypothetical protein
MMQYGMPRKLLAKGVEYDDAHTVNKHYLIYPQIIVLLPQAR